MADSEQKSLEERKVEALERIGDQLGLIYAKLAEREHRERGPTLRPHRAA